MHSGGKQELESLLDFGRLDVQELSEGLEIMSLIRNYSELGKTYLSGLITLNTAPASALNRENWVFTHVRKYGIILLLGDEIRLHAV